MGIKPRGPESSRPCRASFCLEIMMTPLETQRRMVARPMAEGGRSGGLGVACGLGLGWADAQQLASVGVKNVDAEL
jgi:hypothetical protein